MRPANISVRLARPADAGVIAQMSRDLIETGLGWTWTRARVERNIRSASTVAIAVEARERHATRLVGFAIMYFGDDHAHLGLLAVSPDLQRRGVGRALFEWLEQSALVAGIGTIRLELRASNRTARRFYEHLGFTEIARIAAYYGGVEDAVRMAHEIRRGPRGPIPDVRALLKL
jgi:ribosomal-protein-alanine N-acetyltransferase